MRKRNRILVSILSVIVVGLAVLAILISRNADCGPAPALAAGTPAMKAVTARCYGAPDILRLEQVAKPSLADNEVLVKVHVAAVNPLDWHSMRGEPYFIRLASGFGAPEDTSMGVDFAGTVEAVGAAVTRFKPGDQVFGGRGGALADYVKVREDRAIVLKPDNVSFEEAAAVPVAAVTALQALRDKGNIKPGQAILINGASGGVGTYAVQIAKALGAEVTGVCSSRNVEMVRSLGADHVIDYTQQDFTQLARRYDVIIDNVGNHPLLARRRALAPGGTLVIVGGQSHDPWLGPMIDPLKAMLLAPFIDEDMSMLLASLTQSDMQVLADLMRQGKLRSVIDRRYALEQTAEAIEYLETGRARGKVVVNVAEVESPVE